MLEILIEMIYEIFEAGILVTLILIPYKIFQIKIRYIYISIFLGIAFSVPITYIGDTISRLTTINGTSLVSSISMFLISLSLIILSFIIISPKNNSIKHKRYVLFLGSICTSLIVGHEIHEISNELSIHKISNYSAVFLLFLSIFMLLSFCNVINNLFTFWNSKNSIKVLYFLLSVVLYHLIIEFILYSGFFSIDILNSYKYILYIIILFAYSLTYVIFNKNNITE